MKEEMKMLQNLSERYMKNKKALGFSASVRPEGLHDTIVYEGLDPKYKEALNELVFQTLKYARFFINDVYEGIVLDSKDYLTEFENKHGEFFQVLLASGFDAFATFVHQQAQLFALKQAISHTTYNEITGKYECQGVSTTPKIKFENGVLRFEL